MKIMAFAKQSYLGNALNIQEKPSIVTNEDRKMVKLSMKKSPVSSEKFPKKILSLPSSSLRKSKMPKNGNGPLVKDITNAQLLQEIDNLFPKKTQTKSSSSRKSRTRYHGKLVNQMSFQELLNAIKSVLAD